MTQAGWGGGGWGDSAWGQAGADLELLSVQAVRENVVRLRFTATPLFNNLGTSKDAAQPEHYNVRGVSTDARSVAPVSVEQVESAGATLDVTVDRFFSPYPAVYRVSVVGLVSTEGSTLLPGASLTFLGLQQGELPVGSMQSIVAGRDIANPQSAIDLAGTAPSDPNAALGTYQIGPDGDYVSDTPYASWRKRVIRRVVTRLNGFQFLVGYGSGALANVKKLARPVDQALMSLEAERQVRLEPETLTCQVTVRQDGSVTLLQVVATTTLGMEPQSLSIQLPNG